MKTRAIAMVAATLALVAANLPAQPVITTQPTNQAVPVGSNATFSVVVSGTGPFTYQWQFNGTNLPNGTITTVAGNGTSTYSGDGGLATNVGLHNPFGVAVDVSGDLFIADSYNEMIHRIPTNGIITGVAGSNNIFGFSGDGGPAIRAILNLPYSVAVDSFGNLFFADMRNNRVRKLSNGIITTVAGNGSQGYSGDRNPATNAALKLPRGVAVDAFDNLFIADTGNNRVREVGTNGIITTVAGNGISGNNGDGGAATNAALNGAPDVTVDSLGNLFIATGLRIRKVDTNGIITTFAGNGSITYSGDGGPATNAGVVPVRVALDAFGDLFITDSQNNRIRKVDTDGIITTVAGTGTYGYSGDGGLATNASLALPEGIAVDACGNLFIADDENYRIREVLLFSSYPVLTLNNVGTNGAGDYTVIITSQYGSVTSSVATLTVILPPAPEIATEPTKQIVMAGGTATFGVAVSGTGPFTYQWQFNGTNLPGNIITTVAGQGLSGLPGGYHGDGGLAISASLAFPESIFVDASGNLFIADFYNNRIRKVDTSGIITTVAGSGPSWPNNGSYSGDGGPATNASLFAPTAVVLDSVGNMLIADYGNHRIRKVDTNRIITTVAGNGSFGYSGDGGPATNASLANAYVVAVDSGGNLFVADSYNQRVRKVDTNGIITTVAGNGVNSYSGDGGQATNASLFRPYGVAVSTSCNLFIADTLNQRIREVGTNGIVRTVAGSGGIGYSGDGFPATATSLLNPLFVLMDSYSDLFFTDGDNRICKISTNGIITTVAGNGDGGFSGDGGPANNATLSGPFGIAFDSSGNLFIADTSNNRIREVLLFASYPTLKLNNVTTNDAGNYTVVISNAGGSVTSSIVTLTVAVPPNIQTFWQTNGVFNFTWVAVSNLSYQVQYASSLAPPNWSNLLASPITATSAVLSASDSIADVQRFYRVVLLP